MPFLVALLLTLLLSELVLRGYRYMRRRGGYTDRYMLPPPKAAAFQSHPYALIVKRPNWGGMFPSNSLGYAGKREFIKERGPNSLRIYCVGDSTTERHDWREGPDSSWPAKLQDVLAARFPGMAVECINAGTSGYTSAESLTEFLFRGLDLKPDVVLLFHNVNDALTCQMVQGFKSDYSHIRRQRVWLLELLNGIPEVPYIWTFQLLRRFGLRRCGDTNSILYWISRQPPWETVTSLNPEAIQAFRRNIFNLVSVALSWRCVPVLIKFECDWTSNPHRVYYLGVKQRIDDFYFAFLNANNTVLRELGAEVPGCHYLDVGPFESRHFSDTIHFNGAGTGEMARRVADGLDPIIRKLVEVKTSAIRAAP